MVSVTLLNEAVYQFWYESSHSIRRNLWTVNRSKLGCCSIITHQHLFGRYKRFYVFIWVLLGLQYVIASVLQQMWLCWSSDKIIYQSQHPFIFLSSHEITSALLPETSQTPSCRWDLVCGTLTHSSNFSDYVVLKVGSCCVSSPTPHRKLLSAADHAMVHPRDRKILFQATAKR